MKLNGIMLNQKEVLERLREIERIEIRNNMKLELKNVKILI